MRSPTLAELTDEYLESLGDELFLDPEAGTPISADDWKFFNPLGNVPFDAEAFKVVVRDTTQGLRELVDQGWRITYRTLFGDRFVDSLDSVETDDKHHSEAIEWHWNARIELLKGNRPPNDWFAYFPIWPRGNMKTMVAEAMVVVDAVLSVAYKKPGFCLYIGREKDKVKENISNIEALLSSEPVKRYAPELSQVKRNDETGQKRQWTGTFLHTQAQYVIKGATVESAQAGSKIENTRVTFFVPDDIDSRDESPVIAETKFRLLTSEILPMRQENTLTFFAQNLINRYSTMYRIQRGKDAVLANRKPTQPIPAVRDLVTERVTKDGQIRDMVISGKCTWKVWNLIRVQDEIDTYGLPVFLSECQHEVDQSKRGVILYNYDDDVHVISESEFIAAYGSKDVWLTWRKKFGNDWARTKTDKHANVADWLVKSSQDSALPNFTFLMHPMTFPENATAEEVAERALSCLSPFAYKDVTWEQLRKETKRRTNAEEYTRTEAEKIDYERGALEKVIPIYSKPLLQRCNVQQGEMSHEQNTVRKVYTSIYGLGMKPVNPGKHGGTEEINRAMQVDYNEPHAFRPDQKGYTQWYMVVPDDPEAIKDGEYREVNGKKVYRPKPFPDEFTTTDMWDDDLYRFQLKNCRYRPPILTASGEEIDNPEKMWDDVHNRLQMAYCGSPLQGTSLTLEQKVNLIVPQGVRDSVKMAKTADEKLSAVMTLEFEREAAMGKLVPDEKRWELEYE